MKIPPTAENGMAWVIIGGLTSSMFLTLLLVPCMYYIIETLKNKVLGIREKKEAEKMIQSEVAV